jgi:hypothetical protein
MRNTKWIKLFFQLLFLTLLSIMIINYIVDPFQQYRVKTFYPISFDIKDQRYKNAGLSKNFEYDFVIDKTEESLNFNKLIKLSISGGSAREQSTVLKTAIENNKNLKNILWGLDTLSFIGNPDKLKYGPNSFPFYLYDNNKINDNKYLLSFDTLKKSINILFKVHNEDTNYDFNTMYQWQHKDEEKFKIEDVYKAWEKRKTDFNKNSTTEQKFNYLKNSFDINFLSLIQNNPQINFIIFFPPYSILTFKTFEEQNQISDILEFKRYIFDSLLSYKNVKMYDFQAEKSVTHNLNNYKDLSHYHQRINYWMIEQIKENKYLVSKENSDSYIENLKKETLEYNIN